MADQYILPEDFIKYEFPKIGIFRVEKKNGNYSSSDGWEQEEEKQLIIGEDKTAFVYKLKKVSWNESFDGKPVVKSNVIALGIHKTRLVRWLNVQLELF